MENKTVKANKISQEMIDTITNLYKNGCSKAEIRRQTGISAGTIKKYIDIYEASEDKVSYLNRKYGKGNWKFVSKEELVEYLLMMQDLRKQGL